MVSGKRRIVLCALALCALLLPWGQGCAGRPEASEEVQRLLVGPPPVTHTASAAQVWEATRRFYQHRGNALAWSRARPTSRADEALQVLASAVDHGLDPDYYALSELRAMRERLRSLREDGEEGKDGEDRAMRLAAFDVRLTNALLSLGHDVAVGRRRPRAVSPQWDGDRKLPDLAGTFEAALDDGGLRAWLDQVQPRHAGYAALRRKLAGLRARAETGPWVRVTSLLRRGDRGRAVQELRQRLIAGGELAPSSASPYPVFDATLEEAVRSFQYHHGIRATGRVDRATLAALNVPMAARIRQIALNLERWRWLPDQLGVRHLRINIPQFHLEAYENGRRVLALRVIVGKKDAETPVFSDRMTHIVFSPYWNIPDTIAAEEMVPALAEDQEYLARNNIEVVSVSDGRLEPVDPATVDWNDPALLRGLRFRQRPGSSNALGRVKFLFPNRHAVYIHDTPANALFSRLSRTLSHGCVRVEDPVTLATYLLRDQPRWTPRAIRAAMNADTDTHVRLTTPVPIHITYFTAWVDEMGGLHFRPDVYGHDGRQARLMNGTPDLRRASLP